MVTLLELTTDVFETVIAVVRVLGNCRVRLPFFGSFGSCGAVRHVRERRVAIIAARLSLVGLVRRRVRNRSQNRFPLLMVVVCHLMGANEWYVEAVFLFLRKIVLISIALRARSR